MDVTIRKIQKQEYPLLDNFLYEAIFVPEGIEPPPKTIITSPELQVYVERFGESKDDCRCCLGSHYERLRTYR